MRSPATACGPSRRISVTPSSRMPDSRSPARLESPRDVVFRDIIRGLYEGRFAPGQRLVEGDLTTLYGVSRGPVREALSRLAAEGIHRYLQEHGGAGR